MRFAWLLLIIAILGAFSACEKKPSLGKPEIKSIDNRWGTVTKQQTEVITTAKVYNPNPVPIPLKDVYVEIYMNGIKMGYGKAVKAEIPANSESEIIVESKIDNSKIVDWWVSHIQNGEKSIFDIKGNLIFDLKVTDFKYPIEISRPVNTDILSGIDVKDNEISVGPIKLIVSTESRWGNVNKDYTEIITVAKIYNPNMIPVPITKADFYVSMNDVVLAQGESDVSTIIGPNEDSTITIVTKIDNSKIPEWWATHINNGEKSTVRIVIEPYVEVFGKKLKFVAIESKSSFETNMI